MFFNFKLFFRQQFKSLFQSEGTHFRLTWKRIGVLLIFYLLFPLIEIFNWVGFALDDLFFVRYRNQKVNHPVFVLGNYRSGTTFLHRLLALDTRSFTAMAGWEIFLAPSIIQRKFMRAFVAADRALGGHLLTAFDRFWQKNVQKNVTFHQLGVTEPEEDEGILAHIWSGIIPWNLFPIMEDGVPEYATFDTSLSEREKKRVMTFYRRCVQRHLYAHGGRKRYLSKSPSFSGKVDALYKTFPDAKIIYLIRNPLEMVPSAISMWAFKWNVTCSPLDNYPYEDELLEMIKYWYQHPLERLAEAPEDSYLIVRFEELIADPERVVRHVYDHFGFKMSRRFEKRLLRQTQRAKKRSSQGKYSLEEMGLSQRQIAVKFGDVLHRFHFPGSELQRPRVRFSLRRPGLLLRKKRNLLRARRRLVKQHL